MPESSSRKSGKNHMEAARAERRADRRSEDLGPEPLPTWYKVVMFGLMIVGLIWICVYYITMGVWPLPQAGGWNILIGFGFAMIGFLMTTRWR